VILFRSTCAPLSTADMRRRRSRWASRRVPRTVTVSVLRLPFGLRGASNRISQLFGPRCRMPSLPDFLPSHDLSRTGIGPEFDRAHLVHSLMCARRAVRKANRSRNAAAGDSSGSSRARAPKPNPRRNAVSHTRVSSRISGGVWESSWKLCSIRLSASWVRLRPLAWAAAWSFWLIPCEVRRLSGNFFPRSPGPLPLTRRAGARGCDHGARLGRAQ